MYNCPKIYENIGKNDALVTLKIFNFLDMHFHISNLLQTKIISDELVYLPSFSPKTWSPEKNADDCTRALTLTLLAFNAATV